MDNDQRQALHLLVVGAEVGAGGTAATHSPFANLKVMLGKQD